MALEKYDDSKFESAFQAALQLEKRDYPSYVGGMKVASGTTFIVKSPVDESIGFGFFQEPEIGLAGAAVMSAMKCLESWRRVDQASKRACFEKALESLKAQRYRMASFILLSSGMTGKDAVAEVDRVIEIIESECSKEVQAGAGGVWAIVSTCSSPFASPIGYAISAMLAGNVAILVPTSQNSLPLFQMYGIFEKAGLPDGVLNILIDRKNDVAVDIANDPNIRGLVLSGTGEFMDEMMFLVADDQLKIVNEVKGMNPIVVHKPSNVKKAVSMVLESAFSYSGQGLFSTSKLILSGMDANEFVNELIGQLESLKIGDPSEKDTFAGPISADGFSRWNKLISEYGGHLVAGGARVDDEFTKGGYYVRPAMFLNVEEDCELNFMDNGLPILSIMAVDDLDAALDEVENTDCGLSAGLISKDQKAIERFNGLNIPLKFVNESNARLSAAVYAKVEGFKVS